MPNDFDKFVRKLQKEIRQKQIKEHNKKIVDFYYNPQNFGRLPLEEISLSIEGRRGQKQYFFGLYLNINDAVISKAKFITDGCGVMVAIGCQMTLLIEGKSIEFANDLKSEDINSALMGIHQDEHHCLDLAIDTLKSAILKYKYKE